MTFEKKKEVILIGAGNVATHFSHAMLNSGFSVRQVFSRSEESAKALANAQHCDYTTDVEAIFSDADIYVFALKDDILPEMIAAIPPNKGLWLHTAGSVPMNLFRGYTMRYGVIYPLQTLSKLHETDFSQIPLFIEGNDEDTENELFDIAQALSDSVTRMNSDKRKHLHLAAVFACNFSNHMYALAAQLLEKQDIDWRILQPLIDETARKLHFMHPEDAQTGPAVRYDQRIIKQHLTMLEDENTRKLYALISENIHLNNRIIRENTDSQSPKRYD